MSYTATMSPAGLFADGIEARGARQGGRVCAFASQFIPPVTPGAGIFSVLRRLGNALGSAVHREVTA